MYQKIVTSDYKGSPFDPGFECQTCFSGAFLLESLRKHISIQVYLTDSSVKKGTEGLNAVQLAYLLNTTMWNSGQ